MKKIANMLFTALIALFDRAAFKPYNWDAFNPSLKGSVKFSALVTEIKGKVAGLVFQGGKAGTIVKRKPQRNFVRIIDWVYGQIGTAITWGGSYASAGVRMECELNPDGSHELGTGFVNSRQIIRILSKSWSSLTEAERAAWNAAAVNFPFKNRFGEVYTGSGFQVYMSINAKRLEFNLDKHDLPPSPDSPAFAAVAWQDVFVININSATRFFQLQQLTDLPEGAMIVIHAASPVRNGRAEKFAQYKVIGRYTSDIAGTFELLYAYNIFFGVPNVGARVPVRIDVIDSNNGKLLYEFTAAEQIEAQVNNFVGAPAITGYDEVEEEPIYAKAFPWNNEGFITDLGAADVAVETISKSILIKGIQLPAGSSMTLTPGGAELADFSFFYAGSDDALDGPLEVPVNKLGNIIAAPLLVNCTPGGVGVRTATITLTHPSLAAPIVYTFTATGE